MDEVYHSEGPFQCPKKKTLMSFFLTDFYTVFSSASFLYLYRADNNRIVGARSIMSLGYRKIIKTCCILFRLLNKN